MRFDQIMTLKFPLLATNCAKIIISELYLPKKTIKPEEIGGIAGGDKVKHYLSFLNIFLITGSFYTAIFCLNSHWTF
jgi:hypothetical protein